MRPWVLAVLIATGCAMPTVAPTIIQSSIPERNEIARVWTAFSKAIVEDRLDEAWQRLSVHCRRQTFGGDEQAFRRWVTAERDGVLKGIGDSWLFKLELSGSLGAHARPEGVDALAEIRFRREGQNWRINGWTLIPGP